MNNCAINFALISYHVTMTSKRKKEKRHGKKERNKIKQQE